MADQNFSGAFAQAQQSSAAGVQSLPPDDFSNGAQQQAKQMARQLFAQGPQAMPQDAGQPASNPFAPGQGNPLPPDQHVQPVQTPNYDFAGQPITTQGQIEQQQPAQPPQQNQYPWQQQPQQPPQPQSQQSSAEQQPQPQAPPDLRGSTSIIDNLRARGSDVSQFANDEDFFQAVSKHQTEVVPQLRYYANKYLEQQQGGQAQQPQWQGQPEPPTPAPVDSSADLQSTDDDWNPEWNHHIQWNPERNSYVPRDEYSSREAVEKANSHRRRSEANLQKLASNPDKWAESKFSSLIEEKGAELFQRHLQQHQAQEQSMRQASMLLQNRRREFIQHDQNDQMVLDQMNRPMLTPRGWQVMELVSSLQNQFQAANPGAQMNPVMLAQFVNQAMPPEQQQAQLPHPGPVPGQQSTPYQQPSTNQQNLEQFQQRAQRIAGAAYSPSMGPQVTPIPPAPIHNKHEWGRRVRRELGVA